MRRGLHKKLCWLSETRVDRIDRESLRIMRASGCRRLLLGIESGVDLLLENVNKTFTTETTRRAVRMIREEKIDSVGLFMIGLPGEDGFVGSCLVHQDEVIHAGFYPAELSTRQPSRSQSTR